MITSLLLALIALVSLAALCAWLGRKAGRHIAWNAQLGKATHDMGLMPKLADAQIATRYLLVKTGSDYYHIAQISTAAQEPLGICMDQPYAIGDAAAVQLLGANKSTQPMIAAGAIAVDADVYSDGTGKVMAEPVAAGIYWRVGRLVGVAPAASGDMVEVETARAQKLVVLAAFTSVTTAAAVDLPTTEALANALKADVIALRAALATATLLKAL